MNWKEYSDEESNQSDENHHEHSAHRRPGGDGSADSFSCQGKSEIEQDQTVYECREDSYPEIEE